MRDKGPARRLAVEHGAEIVSFDRDLHRFQLCVSCFSRLPEPDTREPLRTALSVFETLGAEPWAARARAELRATGATVLARRAGSNELTPQELRIALAVADGATNREAAAALFLSVKTVEYHLTKVYEKLEARSRTHLARLLHEAADQSPT